VTSSPEPTIRTTRPRTRSTAGPAAQSGAATDRAHGPIQLEAGVSQGRQDVVKSATGS
jgi:hypothetical protein